MTNKEQHSINTIQNAVNTHQVQIANSNKEKKKEEKAQESAEEKDNASSTAAENANHLNLVLIGHVDHGKSTIAGQILLQTGQIEERTIAKYRRLAAQNGRDSWWLAYLLDQDEDERAKGKTVECGKAYFPTPSKRYTILDAPGHLHYVPNMIIGASQADIALLVISARRGEFEAGFVRGGQTREHALIAMTLGISRIVVVVNKMDTVKWKEQRYRAIEKKLSKFLSKEIGYKSKHVSFVPISGQKGTNIKDKVAADVAPWYDDGPSLLEVLDGVKASKRSSSKPLRVTIVDRYKSDVGVQAVGMVQQGVMSVGDTVKIMPIDYETKVVALQLDDETQESVETVRGGDSVVITFDKGDKHLMQRLDLIHTGSVLCSSAHDANSNDDDADDAVCRAVKEFVAEVYVNEIPDGSIVTKGYESMLHCHNYCGLSEIVGIKKSKKQHTKPFLKEGDRAVVKIAVKEECVLEAYQDCRILGRFVLRDKNQTVMIGKIQKVMSVEQAN
jgi:peptide chain release factor subunit 3